MTVNRINIGILIKISIAIAVSLSLLVIIESRGHPIAYFSTRCRDYKQRVFSRKLNDRLVDYSSEAKRSGVSASKTDKEFRRKISDGELVRVRTGRRYVLDRMLFSYPAVTRESKSLLDEIARRFREKASEKGLPGARFYITSMTRKTDDLKNLRRLNTNSSENSPHLYGNAFDISYKRFSAHKLILTSCDIQFLKEVLAEVIWQVRNEDKCWATYERMQNCYHIVAR